MKKVFSLCLLILLINFALFAQRSGWSKHLPNTSYTLRFDPTGLSTILVYNNGSEVTDYNDKLSLLYQQVDNALAQWSAATNYTVSMSRVTSGGNYLMILDAIDSVESLGDAGSPIRINNRWDLTISGTQGNRIHFYSAVIHEIGHLFIGYAHVYDDNESVMYPPSIHTWKYIGEYGGLNQADIDKVRDLYDPPSDVTVKITTAKGDVGGNVKIDGETYWRNIDSDGYTASWRPSTFPHQAEVQNGQTISIGGQNYSSNLLSWYKGATPDGSTNPHSLTVGIPEWKANLDLEYNVTFYASCPGASSNGVIKVAGVQRSSGYTANVWQSNNSLTAEGIQQAIGGIQYTFSKWEDNSTTNPRTFTVTDHGSHTVSYNPKPDAPTSLYTSADPGDQVILCWEDNPNDYVTEYDIYRSPDKNRPYVYAATVSKGTQQWTDGAWRITSSYTDSLVHYRIYAKFNYDTYHVTSDPSNSVSAYAEPGGEAKRDVGSAKFVESKRHMPTECSIGNYPNPFNPSTTMFYQLVENSDVSLEVYDVSGRRVATVVDGQRSAGYHAKVWNAKDNSGITLASGLYFYRFVARPIIGHKPFVTSGKLLLMK